MKEKLICLIILVEIIRWEIVIEPDESAKRLLTVDKEFRINRYGSKRYLIFFAAIYQFKIKGQVTKKKENLKTQAEIILTRKVGPL